MTRTHPAGRTLAALLLCGALSGCLVGPNYRRPVATPPFPAFKEAAGWTPAQPSDAADRKDWWTVFGDPVLDNLEARVTVSNQTLAADEAAYRAARALVREDRAALFPTVNFGALAQVSGGGGKGGGGSTVITNGQSVGGGGTNTLYQPTLGATWAPDIWGAVRRTIENARDNAQASAATLANARLSAQTELAVDYVSLRQIDEQTRLFASEATGFAQTLRVTQNKYAVGVAAKSDVLSAQTQLQSTQATLADFERQRALMEHAIALLAGQPPATLALASGPWSLKLPAIPTEIPSTVLQRRPDIATAERNAAAANALIGVQVAAYYPSLSLSASGGFASSQLGQLFNASNFFWSLGASVAETVFDAGLRKARVENARATYDEAVANYRQTVLVAFGQVEDNLAAQRVYGPEQALLQSAAASAMQNETITRNEYLAGTVDFTTVVTAQATALAARNAELAVEAARLDIALSLIEALGGGWTAADLPKG